MNYRVILSEVTDPHFKPAPDVVLFESDDLNKCEEFFNNYNCPAWHTVTLQSLVMIPMWTRIKEKLQRGKDNAKRNERS